MIDTHCHIDFEDYDNDREDVIKRAKDKLDFVIASGFNRQSNQNVLELSKEYEGFIYPTFGFHPVSSQNSTDEELNDAQNHLIDNLSDIVAVGEVGMDYYYVTDKALRERQQEIFTSFLNLANDHKVPIVMHVRDCEKKAVNIIITPFISINSLLLILSRISSRYLSPFLLAISLAVSPLYSPRYP